MPVDQKPEIPPKPERKKRVPPVTAQTLRDKCGVGSTVNVNHQGPTVNRPIEKYLKNLDNWPTPTDD